MLRGGLGEVLQLQQRGGTGQLRRAPSDLSFDPLWGAEARGGLQAQTSRHIKSNSGRKNFTVAFSFSSVIPALLFPVAAPQSLCSAASWRDVEISENSSKHQPSLGLPK